MEPTTLRLPKDLAETLADEAEDRGYSSRSEYIRRILRNRTDGDSDTKTAADRHRTDYATEYDVSALAERVAELEARVDALEADPTAGGGDRDGAEATAEPPETDDVEPDEFRVGEAAVERADVRAAVDDILDGWRPGRTPGEKREQQRAAGRAALTYLREEKVATAAEFREHVEPQHPVDEQSPSTWWKNSARPALKRAQEAGLVEFVDGTKEWHYVGDSEA